MAIVDTTVPMTPELCIRTIERLTARYGNAIEDSFSFSEKFEKFLLGDILALTSDKTCIGAVGATEIASTEEYCTSSFSRKIK